MALSDETQATLHRLIEIFSSLHVFPGDNLMDGACFAGLSEKTYFVLTEGDAAGVIFWTGKDGMTPYRTGFVYDPAIGIVPDPTNKLEMKCQEA